MEKRPPCVKGAGSEADWGIVVFGKRQSLRQTLYDESMKEYTEMIRAGAAVYLPDFSDLSALEELLR